MIIIRVSSRVYAAQIWAKPVRKQKTDRTLFAGRSGAAKCVIARFRQLSSNPKRRLDFGPRRLST